MKNLKRRLKRLEEQRDLLLKQHEGNELNFTYWGGYELGYVKGKIVEIENIIAELEDKSEHSNCCNAIIDTDEQSEKICSNCGERIKN